MSWVQEKGDLNSLDGSWEFTELADGRTQRRLRARGRSRAGCSACCCAGPAEGKVKEFLTKGAAEGLKRQVESGS